MRLSYGSARIKRCDRDRSKNLGIAAQFMAVSNCRSTYPAEVLVEDVVEKFL